MGHLLKLKCAPSPLNLRILSLTSVPFTLTTGQVPNLALAHTKWITVLPPSSAYQLCLLYLLISAPFLPSPPVQSFILTESYVHSRGPPLLFCPPVSAHFSRPVFRSYFLTILTFFRFTYHILPVYLPHSYVRQGHSSILPSMNAQPFPTLSLFCPASTPPPPLQACPLHPSIPPSAI